MPFSPRPTSLSILILLLCVASALAEVPACDPLTSAALDRITTYVAKLVKLPSQASLRLASSDPQEGGCYRRLEFVRSDRVTHFSLLLSPDQRFLMPQVFDSNIDPAIAEARRVEKTAARINDYIDKNNLPLLGAANAPITVAMFSDLQCPFCRRAMNILETQVLPKTNGRVRLAYISFPLPMHVWAKAAAMDLACLAGHKQQKFWAVQNYLFDHQDELNRDSLAQIILAKATEASPSAALDIDVTQVKHCMESEESLPAVERDLDFGASLGITSTPTLFINGRSMVGLQSAEDVLKLTALPSIPDTLTASKNKQAEK